jgi:hypothetical protein
LTASGEVDTRKRKVTSLRSSIKLEKNKVELPTNVKESNVAAYSCNDVDGKPSGTGSETVINELTAEYKEYISIKEECTTGGQRKRKRTASFREYNPGLRRNTHESNFIICST